MSASVTLATGLALLASLLWLSGPMLRRLRVPVSAEVGRPKLIANLLGILWTMGFVTAAYLVLAGLSF